MTISKKPLWSADDLATIRGFVATVDQGKRPRLEELRVVANVLRPATDRPKKRGPKPYFDLFSAFSFDAPRAARYLKMIRATKSQIRASKRKTRAFQAV